MSEIGRLIETRRRALGLSQKELGRSSGLSDTTICKIENGNRTTPSWESLCRIAKALNIHPFEFMLAVGYITRDDVINPKPVLRNLDKLSETDISCLQLLVDFMIARKGSGERN